MNFVEIASIVGVITSVAAIIGLIIEIRSSRLALRTEALLGLDERFTSEPMLSTRKTAARKLLLSNLDNEELSYVLDFFSMLASLAESKAIDKNTTYDNFSYWIINYVLVGESYINLERERDPNSWLNLERLAKSLIKHEDSAMDTSEKSLRIFLLEESGWTENELNKELKKSSRSRTGK